MNHDRDLRRFVPVMLSKLIFWGALNDMECGEFGGRGFCAPG